MAIAATTALAMVLIASGDLGDLAHTTVLLLLLVFTTVNIAVLVLRRDPTSHSHFRAPTLVPVAGAVVSVALLTTTERRSSPARARYLYDTGQLEVVEGRELGLTSARTPDPVKRPLKGLTWPLPH